MPQTVSLPRGPPGPPWRKPVEELHDFILGLGSRPLVTSSQSSIRGLLASSMARARRRFCPPERTLTSRVENSVMFTSSSTRATASSRASPCMPRAQLNGIGHALAHGELFVGDAELRGIADLRARKSFSMTFSPLPVDFSSSSPWAMPVMTFSSVLLPHPDGPMIGAEMAAWESGGNVGQERSYLTAVSDEEGLHRGVQARR